MIGPIKLAPVVVSGSLLIGAFACGTVQSSEPDGSVADARSSDASTSDAPIALYTIGGTVSGLLGTGLRLQLNDGEELSIESDGSFTFETALTTASSFTANVVSEPRCPQRYCEISNSQGTVNDAHITDLLVSCAEPTFRLVSHNWGELSIRVTDDILSYPDASTAAPRIVVGELTKLGGGSRDTIALDSSRDIMYTPNRTSEFLVWDNASTISGNMVPSRIFNLTDQAFLESVELDEEADRIYLTGGSALYILDNASTLSGEVVPTAKIPLSSPESIVLDRINDRLYVSGLNSEIVFVFDNARTLVSDASPDRTISWTRTTGFQGPQSMALDSCNDRLYLGSNFPTPAGFFLVAFDNASTLSGQYNLDTDTQARLTTGTMGAVVDSTGHLYTWDNVATQVRIYNTPQALSGDVTMAPDTVVNGVVLSSNGIDVVAY